MERTGRITRPRRSRYRDKNRSLARPAAAAAAARGMRGRRARANDWLQTNFRSADPISMSVRDMRSPIHN